MSKSRIQLFNPNTTFLDEALSSLRTIMTSYSLASSTQNDLNLHFDALYDAAPTFDFETSSVRESDFNGFWDQWKIFKKAMSDHAGASIIDLAFDFMNEKFDQFTDIIESISTETPSKMPAYREFDKAKHNIQTDFENLMQIILEQIDGEYPDEKKIQNLMSQRTKIRRIKTDVVTKCGPFFTHSRLDEVTANSQHERCAEIIEEILHEITELPKQAKHMTAVEEKLVQAEDQISLHFKMPQEEPPKKVQEKPTVELTPRLQKMKQKTPVLHKKSEMVTPRRGSVPIWNTQVKPKKESLSEIKPLSLNDTLQEFSVDLSDVESDSSNSDKLEMAIRTQPPLSARPKKGSPFTKAVRPVASDELERLRKENDELHIEIKANKATIFDLTGKLNSSRRELEEAKRAEDDEEILALKGKCESLSNELEQQKDDYNTLLVQLQVAYEDNKDMQNQIDSMSSEISRSAEENEELKKKVRNLQDILTSTPPQFTPAKLNVIDDTEDDDDKDLFKTKVDSLTKERDSLYSNIDKLATENNLLKEKLQSQTKDATLEAQVTSLLSQIRAFEELQHLYDDEFSRMSSLLESDTTKTENKGLFEQAQLHKEKCELLAAQRKLDKELRFFKDLRVQSSKMKENGLDNLAFENTELMQKLSEEQEANRILQEEIRALKANLSKRTTNDINKQLFQAKVAQQKVQIELQRTSVKMIHMKNKLKRQKVQGRSPPEEIKLLEDELHTLQTGYNSVLDWGYEQQALLFKEQANTELQKARIRALEAKLDNPEHDIDSQLLDEMRERIEEAQTAANRIKEARDTATNLYREILQEEFSDEEASVSDIIAQIRDALITE